MPTNRKRITRKLKSIITDSIRHYLETGESDEKDVEVYLLNGSPEAFREKWESLKYDIMADWIDKHPASRPWAWWLYDAKEPRRRIVGKGQTMNEKFPAWLECHDKGIPSSWHWIETNDPPRFESEAVYLDRHGFLAPTEKKALTKKSRAFNPVTIAV